MGTITASEINKRINLLPENLLVKVDLFLNDLSKNNSENDWYNELTATQIKAIEKGEQDIKNGRVFTQEEVKAKIMEYRKSKKTN